MGSKAKPEGIPPQTGADSQAGSPLELPKPALKDALKATKAEFKEDRGGLIAAGMAFYWFLGLFPGLLAAVGVIGLLRLGSEATADLTRAITVALPGDAAQILEDSINGASKQAKGGSLVAAVIGIAIALWSASAGMVAMQQGLNVAYEVGEDRTFVGARARALLLLLITAILGGVSTALAVFGNPIGDALQKALPLGESLGPAFTPLWFTVRWVGAAAALITLFAAFYYLAPNRSSPRWTWITPGGLLGAAIWLVVSFLFSFYVTSFGAYGSTYGSLAGVVVLLLWLYLSALAVMLGGELNAQLERASALGGGQPGGRHEAIPTSGSPRERHDPESVREEMRRRREQTDAWHRAGQDAVVGSGARSPRG